MFNLTPKKTAIIAVAAVVSILLFVGGAAILLGGFLYLHGGSGEFIASGAARTEEGSGMPGENGTSGAASASTPLRVDRITQAKLNVPPGYDPDDPFHALPSILDIARRLQPSEPEDGSGELPSSLWLKASEPGILELLTGDKRPIRRADSDNPFIIIDIVFSEDMTPEQKSAKHQYYARFIPRSGHVGTLRMIRVRRGQNQHLALEHNGRLWNLVETDESAFASSIHGQSADHEGADTPLTPEQLDAEVEALLASSPSGFPAASPSTAPTAATASAVAASSAGINPAAAPSAPAGFDFAPSPAVTAASASSPSVFPAATTTSAAPAPLANFAGDPDKATASDSQPARPRSASSDVSDQSESMARPRPPAAIGEPATVPAVSAVPPTAERIGRATLALLPFRVDATRQIVFNGQTVRPEVVEHEFTNQLATFLVKSRKFDFLDRTRIEKIIAENRLTESEWVAPGQERKIGKLLVADYLVLGDIDRMEFQVTPVDIAITGERTTDVTATFKFQFRVVEVATGKVTYAQSVTERTRSRDIRREVPAVERRDLTLADYRDFLFKKATVKAGNSILAAVYPIKIAAVGAGEVILNRGEGAGISVGDRLEVFRIGVAIVDPDTGEVLGGEDSKVGVITVLSLAPKFAKAGIASSRDGGPAPGDICRTATTEDASQPQAAPERVRPQW